MLLISSRSKISSMSSPRIPQLNREDEIGHGDKDGDVDRDSIKINAGVVVGVKTTNKYETNQMTILP